MDDEQAQADAHPLEYFGTQMIALQRLVAYLLASNARAGGFAEHALQDIAGAAEMIGDLPDDYMAHPNAERQRHAITQSIAELLSAAEKLRREWDEAGVRPGGT